VSWVLLIALFPVAIGVARWVVDRPEDHSGPLYWVAVLLTFILLGLAMYMARVEKQGPIPTWCWIAVAALFAVIVVLRRLLKWR